MRVARTGAVGDITTEDEMRAQYARWARLAGEGHQVPNYTAAEVEDELARRREECHVNVVEFVELEDGRRITADCGLGYGARPWRAFGVPPGQEGPELPHPWAGETLDDVRQAVRFVIEADADEYFDGREIDEEKPGYESATALGVGAEWLESRWARLVEVAASEGVTVTPEELEAAPFGVELTERLLAERQRHLR